jgi:hypothetical protein
MPIEYDVIISQNKTGCGKILCDCQNSSLLLVIGPFCIETKIKFYNLAKKRYFVYLLF